MEQPERKKLKSTYKSAPAPVVALPSGWSEHTAPSGHKYFYNAQTGESTYSQPSSQAPAQQTIYQPPSVNPQTVPNEQHNAQSNGAAQQTPEWQRRMPKDRPKRKKDIPDCKPWILVYTNLGRRFVHNKETRESFWKFPEDVMKAVVELDRVEWERKREELDGANKPKPKEEDSSSEYEEVEVTDDEAEANGQEGEKDKAEEGPVEFDEDDIAYQLAAMGDDYGLDPGEYDDGGDNEYEEGAEGLPLTEEDSSALFRDLLDDWRVNPYTPFDTLIENGDIIEDERYTVLPSMKARRDVWSAWSRDRIAELKAQRERAEKQDPRIPYLSLLAAHATPKLFWQEFKRKYRKEPEMRDSKLSDRDREKLYREHINRLKLPGSTLRQDLIGLLKGLPLRTLNRDSSVDALPAEVRTDVRYISLVASARDPIIREYLDGLAPAPEEDDMAEDELEHRQKAKADRSRREKALADREQKVDEERRKQDKEVRMAKARLRENERDLEQAMRVGQEGLRSQLE